MKKYFVCIAVISAIVVLSAISAFAQGPQTPAKDDTTSTQGTQAAAVQTPPAAPVAPAAPAAPVAPAAIVAAVTPAETAPKTSELSIYGEVQVVNLQAALISVQYYDYDNDEEKTLEISIDKDSKLENVKALDGVKKGDWVDATYTVTGGKNIAKMISVEVEEPAVEENAPVDTAAQ